MSLLNKHQYQPLRKIPKFHLISWCGNFEERNSFRIVSGESPKSGESGESEIVPFLKSFTPGN